MESNVFFYSERGLVNCLVLDLKNDLEKTKNFFKLIKFGEKEIKPSWADNILSVDWYIEFSASEFGNPDLIADIHCTDKHRVVFFEAKLRSYKQSAESIDLSIPFNPQKDGVYKGKASSINAQLALRYRLAQVLKDTDLSQIPQQEEQQIEENYDKTELYHDMFKAIRTAKTGRRIHNDRMIDVLRKLMQNKPDCFFVAMTFETETKDRIFESIRKERSDLLPPIGVDQWDTANEQFGILNFNEVSKAIPKSQNSYLSLSWQYINPKNNDIDSEDYIEQESIQEEITINGAFSSDEASDDYDDWRALLQITANNQYINRSERSCSILKGTQVIIKLIRRRDGVYLGFRDQLPDSLKALDLPNDSFSIRNVRFAAVSIHSTSQEILLDAVKSLL